MKLLKKTIFASALGLTLFTLTACSEDKISEDAKAQVSGTIGKNATLSTEKPDLKSITGTHEIDFNGTKLELMPEYGVESNRANNWLFTANSYVQLSLGIKNLPNNLEISVNNIYSDVSIISDYLITNGIRQDSLNISYSSMPTGGINFDSKNPYTVPFQIEGINQNESSFMMINGYGSSSTERLDEEFFRDHAKGAKLNVVWTILIKDKSTNQQFVKTINDSVGLGYKFNKDQSND